MENLGFGLALIAALAWGTYMVPLKLSKSDNLDLFQALMGVGILISGAIISLIFGYSINLNIYALFSGFLWALANSIFLPAVKNLGLSKAAPIVAAMVIIGTFFWGVFIFGEIPAGLTQGLIGILVILTGVVLVSPTSQSVSSNAARSSYKKGFLTAITAGFIWASQIVPLKIGHVSTEVSFFPICLGIFVTGLCIAFIKRVKFERKAIGASLLSGAIWNIGNITSLIALSMIGLSKAFPITQSANLVAVLWGIFFFKEIKERRFKIQILIGAVILMIGIVTLGFA